MPKKIEGSSINDQLANSFVTLTANLQRLSVDENIVVQGVLKDLELDIVGKLQDNPDMTSWRKARYNALLSQTKETIAANYAKISEHHQEFLTQVGNVTGGATSQIFTGVGIPLQSVIVTPEQWKTIASRSLIQGAPSSAWWAKQSQNLQDAFVQQMRIGYASGESVDDLVRRVRGTPTGRKNNYEINGKTKVFVEFHGGIMDTGTRQAQALVRTSVQQMAADSKMEMFRKNADILKGVMWLSTLDARTTPLCRSRDGLLYDLDGQPIGHNNSFLGGPPAHWNCRSTLVPVTKSFEELGGSPGVTASYLEQIGEGTRASMNGQVPASLTFDSWFNTLPEKDQIAFLGPKKYKIWKEAGLNFTDMVDQVGNPLTLEQLANAYGVKIKQSIESGLPNIPKQMVSAIAVEQQAQILASKMANEAAQKVTQDAISAIQAMAESEDLLTKQVYDSYKSALPEDPQEALAFLKSKIDQTKLMTEAVKDIVGSHELNGSMLKIGSKTFDITDAQDLKDFKKYKSMHLSKYKQSILAGKTPAKVDKLVYDNLSAVEKQAFDDSITASVTKKKVVPPTSNAVPKPGQLQMAQMEKIGDQLGSNPGGFYRDKISGTEYYIKFPASEDIARNELLASKLYEAAGVEVPELTLLQDGERIGIASKVKAGLAKGTAVKLAEAIGSGNGYAIDAWLANWDVVGLEYDNLLLTEAGTAFRVDVGGSLRYRAMGGLKGNAFGDIVSELESLRDPRVNRLSASVFKDLKQADLEAGVRKVLEIPDDEIRRLVNEYGPHDPEIAKQLGDKLIARKNDLAKKFPHLVKSTTVSPLPDIGDFVGDAEVIAIRNARINGYAIPADRNFIEDQSILVWFEKNEAGAEFTGLRLKFTQDIQSNIDHLVRGIPVYSEQELRLENEFFEFRKKFKELWNLPRNLKGQYINRTLSTKNWENLSTQYEELLESAKSYNNDLAKQLQKLYAKPMEAIKKNLFPEKGIFKPSGLIAKGGFDFHEFGKVNAVEDVVKKLRPEGVIQTELVFKEVPAKFYKSSIKNGYAVRTDKLMEQWNTVYEATTADGIKIRVWPNQDVGGRALQNQIEILTPGASKQAINKTMKLIEQELKLPVALPTAMEREEMYLRMIARSRGDWELLDHVDGLNQHGKSVVDYLKEQLSAKIGADITKQVGYNPLGVHEAFDSGFTRWYMPGIDTDKKMQEFLNEHVLYHSITADNSIANALDNILNSGGKMVPTAHRTRYGIPWGGMSPQADMQSGGADYFFTRVKTIESVSSERGLVWDSKQLTRLDVIVYDTGHFGRTIDNFVRENSQHGVDGLKRAVKDDANEVIFKGGMSLFDRLNHINCRDAEEANEVLSVLAKHGWQDTWVDGRKVTDIVRVKGMPVK